MTHSTTENSSRPREHTRPNRITCADQDTDRCHGRTAGHRDPEELGGMGTGNDMPDDCRDR